MKTRGREAIPVHSLPKFVQTSCSSVTFHRRGNRDCRGPGWWSAVSPHRAQHGPLRPAAPQPGRPPEGQLGPSVGDFERKRGHEARCPRVSSECARHPNPPKGHLETAPGTSAKPSTKNPGSLAGRTAKIRGLTSRPTSPTGQPGRLAVHSQGPIHCQGEGACHGIIEALHFMHN